MPVYRVDTQRQNAQEELFQEFIAAMKQREKSEQNGQKYFPENASPCKKMVAQLYDFNEIMAAINKNINQWHKTCENILRHGVAGTDTALPENLKEIMVEFYADLYSDYYAGHVIRYEDRVKEKGYQVWEQYRNHTKQFRQIEGMLKDRMADNNNAEIPNPVYQIWKR